MIRGRDEARKGWEERRNGMEAWWLEGSEAWHNHPATREWWREAVAALRAAAPVSREEWLHRLELEPGPEAQGGARAAAGRSATRKRNRSFVKGCEQLETKAGKRKRRKNERKE